MVELLEEIKYTISSCSGSLIWAFKLFAGNTFCFLHSVPLFTDNNFLWMVLLGHAAQGTEKEEPAPDLTKGCFFLYQQQLGQYHVQRRWFLKLQQQLGQYHQQHWSFPKLQQQQDSTVYTANHSQSCNKNGTVPYTPPIISEAATTVGQNHVQCQSFLKL